MITPDTNARILELEIYGTRAAPVQQRYRLEPKERRGTPMKYYTKYLRYALSNLVTIAFGAQLPN